MTTEHRKYLKQFSRCELCGSPKSLELHHIIPTAFGGPDVMDNWIAICSGCHAKLTPRKLLINKGIAKHFNPIADFYKAIQDDLDYAVENDDYSKELNEATYVLDMFDLIFNNPKNPVEARYISKRYKEQSV